MRIIRRISLVVFGLMSGLLGFVSVFVAVVLTVGGPPATGDLHRRVFLGVWIFVICEILAAFGVAALLLGLKHILGPRQWLSHVLDASWKKAMKFALIVPWLGFGIALIGGLIDWLAG